MDIRTKLSLVLIAVAVTSMALLGYFAYRTSAVLLQEISVRQLDALAESKKRDIKKVYEGWQDQLRLIRSRTQLQNNLKLYLESEDPAALREVTRIIEDATTAVDQVDRLSVFDTAGKEIASFGRVPMPSRYTIPDEDIAYGGTFEPEGGGQRISLNTALKVDGQVIGGMEMVVDGFDLFDVTGNYTGLGESGETFLVRMEDENTVRIVNPLRHDAAAPELIPLQDVPADIAAALDKREEIFTKLRDYRDVRVWSATRHLPTLGWGLIVKVDASEEEARADILRDTLFDIAAILGAFAFVGGVILGFRLAKPIHDLAVVVERIREGDASVRADTSGDDEIAYLAESINELMDHLQSEDKQRS